MTWANPRSATGLLQENHYLGAMSRGVAWIDQAGCIIIAQPTSRRIPREWLELVRWCIVSREKNAGSQQWGRFVRCLKKARPELTTIISYSDPEQGHTGALYRACNWWWAPTWHRLRPPPSGQGSWSSGLKQAVKDRWVFPVADDERRLSLLTAKDDAVLAKMPFARYREPGGADYKQFAALCKRDIQ